MREAIHLIREGNQRPSSGLELETHLMREAIHLIRGGNQRPSSGLEFETHLRGRAARALERRLGLLIPVGTRRCGEHMHARQSTLERRLGLLIPALHRIVLSAQLEQGGARARRFRLRVLLGAPYGAHRLRLEGLLR